MFRIGLTGRRASEMAETPQMPLCPEEVGDDPGVSGRHRRADVLGATARSWHRWFSARAARIGGAFAALCIEFEVNRSLSRNRPLRDVPIRTSFQAARCSPSDASASATRSPGRSRQTNCIQSTVPISVHLRPVSWRHGSNKQAGAKLKALWSVTRWQ